MSLSPLFQNWMEKTYLRSNFNEFLTMFLLESKSCIFSTTFLIPSLSVCFFKIVVDDTLGKVSYFLSSTNFCLSYFIQVLIVLIKFVGIQTPINIDRSLNTKIQKNQTRPSERGKPCYNTYLYLTNKIQNQKKYSCFFASKQSVHFVMMTRHIHVSR